MGKYRVPIAFFCLSYRSFVQFEISCSIGIVQYIKIVPIVGYIIFQTPLTRLETLKISHRGGCIQEPTLGREGTIGLNNKKLLWFGLEYTRIKSLIFLMKDQYILLGRLSQLMAIDFMWTKCLSIYLRIKNSLIITSPTATSVGIFYLYRKHLACL